jgi:hypothetical protein
MMLLNPVVGGNAYYLKMPGVVFIPGIFIHRLIIFYRRCLLAVKRRLESAVLPRIDCFEYNNQQPAKR